jgi:large subunit ribosomal protein L29
MASNKFIELKGFSDAELASELENIEREYHKMQFDHASKGLDNPLTLRETRRDIARVKTEMRRRELEQASPAQIEKRSKIRARRRNQ